MRALILCAGNGVRLGYRTKPKCMARINKKPILEHLVDKLNKAGITEIIVNIHHNYEPIFKYFGTRLLYFYEPTLLGEAGTEKLLKDWLGDKYIVMNGDTMSNIDINKLIGEAKESTFFCKNDKYAGTKLMFKKKQDWEIEATIDDPSWRYFDCGTPKKLAKARRFYK